jgi:heat shock protein HtpX
MNGLKTTLLLGVLSGIFLAIGYAYGGQDGIWIALVFAVIMNAVSYWFSDKIVLAMYRAKEITPGQAPALGRIVQEIASRAGIPTPKLYLIDLPAPNAFATGRNPSHAAVAVSRSLMDLLNENELRAVIAHEMGHVLNRDILVSSVAATIASAVSSLAHMLQWGMILGGGGSSRDRGNNPLAMLALIILTPIIALIIQLAISRTREYGADEASAKLTGAPLDLASALKKLEFASQRMPFAGTPRQQTTASLFIINPFRGTLSRLFSTHPPLDDRIARLEEMARGSR